MHRNPWRQRFTLDYDLYLQQAKCASQTPNSVIGTEASMATTGLMLQLEVEQQLSTDVSTISEIFAEALTFLNGGTVTVTEIAVQKLGGVFGNNIAIPIDDSPTGYVTLRVFTGGNNEVDFFAPSSVPSPPVQPGLAALLELSDAGFTAPQNVLQVARKLGAHVYFEES